MHKKTNSRYYKILGRNLLTALGLDLKFSEDIIMGGEGPYEECSEPIVDLSNYEFKPLTENTVKLEESFIKLYVDELLKSKSSTSSTRRTPRILYAKYEKSDLGKFMTEKCQHLFPSKREIPLSSKN